MVSSWYRMRGAQAVFAFQKLNLYVRLCVRPGQSQLIDLLVCKGAPVNATDYHALTPLHLACQRGYQGVTVNGHTHTHTQKYLPHIKLKGVSSPSLFVSL